MGAWIGSARRRLRGAFRIRDVVRLATGLILLTPAPSEALDPARAFSQYRHAKYGSEDGLPHDVISDIVQDGDGYLWIATLDGLARFDGQRMSVFDTGNTRVIKSNVFRDLEPAPGGGLWCATDGGLLRYSAGAFKAYSTLDGGLPSDVVQAVCTDEDGAVWAGTDRGLWRLSDAGSRVYTTRDGLPSEDVIAIARCRTGGIWVVCGDRGLVRVIGASITPVMGDSRRLPEVITLVRERADGGLWLGSSQGLALLKDSAVQLYTTSQGLSHNLVASFLEDGDGTGWVGTHRGLCRISGGRVTPWSAPADPISGMITAICEDTERNLWLGTSSGMLHQLSDGPAATFGRGEGLPEDFVMPLCTDRNGRVWIGTINGLCKFENGAVASVELEKPLPSELILALFEDRQGSMWVGTKGGGLCRIRDRRLEIFTGRDGLPSLDVFSLCEDAAGTLWIGTRKGLCRYESGRFTSEPQLTGKTVPALLYQPQTGTLWIGTAGDGLLWRSESGTGAFGIENGLASEVICCIVEGAGGELWIGTDSGLGLVRGRRAISLRGDQHGFYRKEIFQVIDDHRGNLWMGTREGIISVRRKDLLDVVDGALGSIGWVRYGREDGMRVAECNGMFQPAGCVDGLGRMWFPSPEGAVMIDPARDRGRVKPPPVRIESFVVDGEEVGTAGPIALPAGKKSFGFRYTAPSFSAPARVTFRHRLDGIDAGWVETGGSREVLYANLLSGTYRFHVTASTGGDWNPSGAVLEFRVGRHVYEAPWFYALCTIAAVAGLRWLYRIRTEQLRARIAVSEERLRISRELHDTVTQDLTGIVMQLQAARSFPEGALGRVRESIGAALESATTSVDEIRRVVWELREPVPDRVDIAAYLREMLAHNPPPGGGVSVEVSSLGGPVVVPGPLLHHLMSIVREGVHNALRHSDARHIIVQVAGGRRSVKLDVRDDGKGFEPEREGERDGRHVGLSSMRERAKKLDGALTIVSRAGEGTVVTIDVPLTRRGYWRHKGDGA